MKRTLQNQIICEHCVLLVGMVYEDEDPARPGFYANRCVPNPMPTRCDVCHGALKRISGVLIT